MKKVQRDMTRANSEADVSTIDEAAELVRAVIEKLAGPTTVWLVINEYDHSVQCSVHATLDGAQQQVISELTSLYAGEPDDGEPDGVLARAIEQLKNVNSCDIYKNFFNITEQAVLT